MTPQEAVTFAATLEDLEYPNLSFDRLRIAEDMLAALEAVASPAMLKKALQELCDTAEYFRYSNAPGHELWYQPKLRSAAEAAVRWGLDT